MIDMPKVMVTGAGGFVGRHLVKMLAVQGFSVAAYCHKDLELTDSSAVEAAVKECRPDFLVNCAAISSTVYSEEHPDESMSMNVDVCVILAKVCRELGIKLFVMSSDQVYRGCTLWGALPESTENVPGNVYGRHKLLMEQLVLAENPDAVALRLAWMFEKHGAGEPPWAHEDLISRLIDTSRSGGTMKASTRELRGISDVDEVCANIIKAFSCCEDGSPLPGGVYNFGSENENVTYITMSHVAPFAGIPAENIIPDDSWGRNLSMDCSKLSSFGIKFRDTESAICQVFE